jgi:hypothetical protein
MAPLRTTPERIREQGLDALVKALGPVDMARFLQQFELGSGDYTRDREEWLRDITIDGAVAEIKSHPKKRSL